MSNILDTTLAMLGIEDYIKEFHKNGIDLSILPHLSDNDLKFMGIENEELRKRILKQFSTLPSAHNTHLDLTVNNEYMIKVLNDINYHILLLNASLSYAYHNKSNKRTDVKLSKASKCLLQCTESIEKRINLLQAKFAPYQKKKNNWKYFTLILLVATTSVFGFKRYIK